MTVDDNASGKHNTCFLSVHSRGHVTQKYVLCLLPAVILNDDMNHILSLKEMAVVV